MKQVPRFTLITHTHIKSSVFAVLVPLIKDILIHRCWILGHQENRRFRQMGEDKNLPARYRIAGGVETPV